MSRGVQNLTARYNYIYNSNVILNSYAQQLLENYPDNYSEILPVYVTPEKFNPLAKEFLVPPSDHKELDQIMIKAQFIISDKSYSNYIDDAYLLLGKVQFHKGNYFIAAEYFDYIIKNFKQNNVNYLEGLNWKIRCLIQLNNLRAATPVLDSLSRGLETVKSDTSEPMATFAQMSINLGRTEDAIGYLETAIKKTSLKSNKLRWLFVLGQIYEKEKNYKQALDNYTKVQKSNAGFELYFNANLNRIKMNALLNGQIINRKQQLTRLLKDDKNTDYIDQIYYHIGESYAEDTDYKKAQDYYQLSVKSSTKNQYQKGLSYLKIAELNFKHFNNYVKAKTYYDSTVNTLPNSYPGYETILKINQNLQYLTDRYNTIALQDTLQLIAKLPEERRALKLQSLFPDGKLAEQPAPSLGQVPKNPFQDTFTLQQANVNSSFYFSNATAMSKGYSDFKKRWGNRKKQDNWRQSIRSSSQTNTQNVAALSPEGLPENPDQKATETPNNLELLKEYTALLPLTQALLNASNEKILDAYFEIATFYQQELNEIEEANRIYQIILNRFPDNKFLAAIDYSLYLNYKTINPAKSDIYKNLILSKFPSSVYSQSILDPSFSLKQSALDATANEAYNDLFADYLKKDFYLVIKKVDSFTVLSPQNYLAAQFAYLKAISVGRTKPVDSLTSFFKEIIIRFPDDQLIVPLVKNHLDYITKHYADFRKRKVALIDFDPNEPRFFAQIKKPENTAISSPVTIVAEDQKTPTIEPPKSTEHPEPVIAVHSPAPGSTFSTAISETYYFVIDVTDGSLTLSSSRFGIGQFNRGTYPESNLKHQLVEFDDDQLIFVGNFSNFAEAKTYAERITPQFRQIMKMSPRIYKSFIISKENFDKLKNRDLLNQYVEFYKNNYP
jgi:tetratricopeptide (TPR) repeat protein